VLTIDQLPTHVSEFMLAVEEPVGAAAVRESIPLLVGMIMESIAAILILAPIFTPALMAAGVDPAPRSWWCST
jgi:TRAP-type C4-dicarboxylate transport system permease large subunit